jgi:VanZ family protein
MNKRIVFLLLYILLIIALSLIDSKKINSFLPIWKYDKLFHFFEYLILGLLSASAIRSLYDNSFIVITIIFIIFFPFLDETIQYFIPSRVYDIKDIVVDIIGAHVGLIIYIQKLKRVSS